MARATKPLTVKEIDNANPREKEYKLFDGGGLYMTITPDGGKRWRLKYNFEGKEKRLSLGIYPDIELKIARKKREELRKQIANGIDPSAKRKEAKAIIEVKTIEDKAHIDGQFHRIVYGWLDTLTNDETTKTKRKRAFERDIFPFLCIYDNRRNIVSSKHIGEINHPELLKIITAKEKTAPETARRLLTDCGRLWLYAISHGHALFNITTNISKKDALQKQVKKHYAKITDEKILGELLRAINDYNGVIVRNVLRFVAIIPLRADNLCKLKWSYVDFDKEIITIPRSEMKVKDRNMSAFILPLPHQAVAILKEIKDLTGWGEWVFHGISQPLAHVGLESANKALRSMGFIDELNGRKQTLHSFRGTFRSLSETYAREHGTSFEARERVLHHQETDQSIRAYTHKADYTEQMRELLQWWADYLDKMMKQ